MEENKTPDRQPDELSDQQSPVDTVPPVSEQDASPEPAPAEQQPADPAPETETPSLSWQKDSTSGYQMPEKDAAPAVPQRGKLPVVLIAVIAVLLIGIISVIASLVLTQSPEKAVQSAIGKTGEIMNKRTDKLLSELPALSLMNQAQVSNPEKTNFKLSLEGISGAEDDLSMAMISNMLKGLAISGDIAVIPERELMELNAQVGLGDLKMLDGYFYFTPDEMAMGVPAFSDTLFSLSPTTIKQDYFSSAFYEMETLGMSADEKAMYDEMLGEQLDSIQQSFQSLSSSVNFGFDSKEMQNELNNRLNGIYTEATYQKLASKDGMKVYQANLKGASVRNAVIDIVRYIYLESPIVNMYDSVFTEDMLGGMTYLEMMEQQLVQPLENNLKDVPLTVTYQVDGSGIIRKADIEIDPTAINASGGGWLIEKAIGSFSYDDKKDSYVVTADIQMKDAVQNLPYTIQMDISDGYENGLYSENVNFSMKQDFMNLNMHVNMALDKEGKCDFNMDMLMGSDSATPEYSYAQKIEIAAGGGVKVDGDRYTWSYPAIDMKIGEGSSADTIETLGGIKLAWESQTEPIASDYAPNATFTPLFSMTAAELESEIEKYNTAMQNLSQQIFGMLMGGM